MKVTDGATVNLHHGHPLRPCIDQLLTGRAHAHIQLPNIHRGRPLDRLLDPTAVPIIPERGRHPPLHNLRGPVFGIPGEGAAPTPAQVAVGIIAVGHGRSTRPGLGHGMRPRAAGAAGVIGIAADLGIREQVPDLVVGIADGAVAARGAVGGPGQPVQGVIAKRLVPVTGIRQARDVAPVVEGIAQILERRAAVDRLEGLKAVVLRVISIGGGSAIAQGEGAGLARCIAATRGLLSSTG